MGKPTSRITVFCIKWAVNNHLHHLRMRAKHLDIQEHKDLYHAIFHQINTDLKMDKREANWYFILKGLFYVGLACGSYFLIFTITHPLLFVLNFTCWWVRIQKPGKKDILIPIILHQTSRILIPIWQLQDSYGYCQVANGAGIINTNIYMRHSHTCRILFIGYLSKTLRY